VAVLNFFSNLRIDMLCWTEAHIGLD